MRSESASLAVELPFITRMPWHHRRLVDHLGRLQRGTLQVQFGDFAPFTLRGNEAGPEASILVRHPAALLRRLFWRGDLGFAEAFMAQEWDSPHPARLLELLALNADALAASGSRHGLAQLLVGARHWLNRNTRRGSRRNIAAHYDLGNDFYARWLDPGMTYSAAAFDRGGSLAEAQQRKYQRMLELIDAAPGAHILEIGCGWGGFAEHAARQGYRVTGITLSAEQLAFARERIARAGLRERVTLALCDYRDLEGQFDHVVSIEMFEAVGREYWSGYFETLQARLRPGGRAALQVITIDETRFDAYATNPGGFIQSYIFPGGMLPTRRHLREYAAAAGLEPGHEIAFGLDYADTLAQWDCAFARQTEWLDAHGYDERFRRMWHYYLAFCEAGFRSRHIDVVQTVLHKP